MQCFALAQGVSELPATSAKTEAQGGETRAADELMKKLPKGGQQDFYHLLLAAVQMVRSGGADKASASRGQQNEARVGEGPPATLDGDVQLAADADGSADATTSTTNTPRADSVEQTRQKRREDARVARQIAARILVGVMQGSLVLEPRLSLRLMQSVGVSIKDLAQALGETDASPQASAVQGRDGLGVSAGGVAAASAAAPAPSESPEQALVRTYVQRLLERRAYPAAVGVMQHLEVAVEQAGACLVDLVETGMVDLAADCAAHLGAAQYGRHLVRSCMKRGLFKPAHKIVTRLGLEDDFPDSYILYRKR